MMSTSRTCVGDLTGRVPFAALIALVDLRTGCAVQMADTAPVPLLDVLDAAAYRSTGDQSLV